MKLNHDENQDFSSLHAATTILKNRIPSDIRNRDIESYNDRLGSLAAVYAFLSETEVEPSETQRILTSSGDNILANGSDIIAYTI